jgi:hypothetical protein
VTAGREITTVDITTDKDNLTNIYHKYSDIREPYKASKLETADKRVTFDKCPRVQLGCSLISDLLAESDMQHNYTQELGEDHHKHKATLRTKHQMAALE